MKQSLFTRTVAIAAFTIALTLPFSLYAETKGAEAAVEKPYVAETVYATMEATVVDINYDTRVATLKDAGGNLKPIVVGPEVIRLKEVKKGDIVRIGVLESVAIMVQPPGEVDVSAEGSKSVIVREKNKKPSGTKAETETITATIVSIDLNKRTAVLRGPKGKEMKVNIAQDIPNLENVKKGDEVVVSKTSAIAISVEKQKK